MNTQDSTFWECVPSTGNDNHRFTLRDTHVANPLERFMTRLLRREIFNALAAQSNDETKPYKLVLFGSAIPQLYRPTEGFPVRRLARDIDIGVVKNPKYCLTDQDKTDIGNKILDAIQAAGAQVLDADNGKSMDGRAAYDGFIVHKTYDVASQKTYLHGKLEENMTSPDHPLDTPLMISEVYERFPLLPLVRLGNSSLYHEDIREVMGKKLYRMVTPDKFELKDVMDMYNMLETGIIDPKRDGELLRTIALCLIASKGAFGSSSLRLLLPTDENVTKAAKAMGVDDIVFMHRVFERVYETVRMIYAKRAEEDLPPRMSGELNFTLAENNFCTQLRGVTILPGGIVRERCGCVIAAGQIVSNELESQFPGLRSGIQADPQLQQVVERAEAKMCIGD